MIKKRSLKICYRAFAICPLMLGTLLWGSTLYADNLLTTQQQITATPEAEVLPILGNDGISDYVVFNRRFSDEDSRVYVQRINPDGSPSGNTIAVSNGFTSDIFADAYGHNIVYMETEPGESKLHFYNLQTGVNQVVYTQSAPSLPRVSADYFVWENSSFEQVEIMQVADVGTGQPPIPLAGPVPFASQPDIDTRFVVWVERLDYLHPSYINSLDLSTLAYGVVESDPNLDLSNPRTSDNWVTWLAHGNDGIGIFARNMQTNETRTIAPFTNDHSLDYTWLSINGDLVVYNKRNSQLNDDVYLYRLSTMETFRVTEHPASQYVPDVFGSFVSYMDERNIVTDIYIASLVFEPTCETGNDVDADGVCDSIDNCPLIANQDQADTDSNGIGDACELPDADHDGVIDTSDLCPSEDATGFDANHDGCIDTLGGLANVLSVLLNEGVIESQIATSLTQKVSNAQSTSNKDQICAAVSELEAFKNQVEAQRGKKISDEAASLLIEYTDNVINQLLGQLPVGESC